MLLHEYMSRISAKYRSFPVESSLQMCTTVMLLVGRTSAALDRLSSRLHRRNVLRPLELGQVWISVNWKLGFLSSV